jgi:hypothetical protein
MAHLAGRASVDAHESERTDERQYVGVALRLEGEAKSERHADPIERVEQAPGLLLDPHEVVREHRRAVLTRDGLGIAAGDMQTSVANLQTVPLPPLAHAPRLPGVSVAPAPGTVTPS